MVQSAFPVRFVASRSLALVAHLVAFWGTRRYLWLEKMRLLRRFVHRLDENILLPLLSYFLVGYLRQRLPDSLDQQILIRALGHP